MANRSDLSLFAVIKVL